MSSTSRSRNPFGVTKAVDLDDAQIQALWVDVLGIDDELSRFGHPTSAMPSFVLGAKGSGKTHLMRYHSFELQMLRYGQELSADQVQAGVKKDGYIGIYALCGSIASGRFAGKRQTDERWRELFAYYLELWLSHHLLQITDRLLLGPELETAICDEICALFDRPMKERPRSIRELALAIAALQRALDYAVNNVVMTGELQVDVLATRGRLIFGIPKVLAARCEFLKDVLFVYSIDEFENLTFEQQKVVNSLIRDKQIPATLRVGARLYGVRTSLTDGSEEENRKDSEFEVLYLDRIFRNHKPSYAKFAKALASKRLQLAYRGPSAKAETARPSFEHKGIFATIDESWNSDAISKIAASYSEGEPPHLNALRTKLSSLRQVEVDAIVHALTCQRFPLLEKLNVLRFYKSATRRDDRVDIAKRIGRECGDFINRPDEKTSYATAVDHYRSDLIAQLRRENGKKQYYLGLDTFIRMSAGLPRALLTILRSVFDWSTFRGEGPLETGLISVEAQYRGVRDASDWFYENMRKTGDDGRVIQAAIDRLAQLFRVNRFADRPAEISLCAFAIADQSGSPEACRVLRLAEERSFLNRTFDIRKDKNTGSPHPQFQINPMLAPRWDLPLARRGVPELSVREFDAIFAPINEKQFEAVLEEWKQRTSFSIKTENDSRVQDHQRTLL